MGIKISGAAGEKTRDFANSTTALNSSFIIPSTSGFNKFFSSPFLFKFEISAKKRTGLVAKVSIKIQSNFEFRILKFRKILAHYNSTNSLQVVATTTPLRIATLLTVRLTTCGREDAGSKATMTAICGRKLLRKPMPRRPPAATKSPISTSVSSSITLPIKSSIAS